MSVSPERARELLGAQLDELNSLRNAHARDPRFKQWRQATLTVIQRIWPGDTARAERFRRVPFSPPSNKMSLRVTRSFYEKGCAEAVKLIRAMIPELKGAVGRSDKSERSSAPRPGEIEDDFPIVDLPGASAPRARDDDDEPEQRGRVAIPPAPIHKEKPEPKRPDPPAVTRVFMKSGLADAEPIPERGKPGPRPTDSRPPLREMLGFSSQPFDDEPAPASDDTPVYDEEIEAPTAGSEWEVEESTVDEDAAESWEEEFQLPVRARKRPHRDEEDDDDATARIIETEPENFPPAEVEEDEGLVAEEDPVIENAEDDDTGNAMEEFLRTSPVLKASARPVRPRGGTGPSAPASPAAASLVALASEVAVLGVPEGQRAGMRATLIELARRVDERSLDWDVLRDSFQAVLDFPPLARRVIPLLIPYLDVAA